MSNGNRLVLEFLFDGKGAVTGIKNMEGAILELDKHTKNTDLSTKSMFKAFLAADMVSDAIKKVGSAISSIPGEILNVGQAWERYKTVLENALGSQEAANTLFKYLVDLSAQTPYTIDQLVESAVKLENYGIKTKEVLVTLGDTAASLDKPVTMAVEAIADAMMGEFERLKEFGTKVIKDGSQDYMMYIDKTGQTVKKAIDRNNPEIIKSTLLGIWNEKYGGGMEKLSGTWSGMMSTLRDKFTLIMGKIAESGFFKMIKDKLDGILSSIDKWFKDGTIERVSKSISNAFVKIINTGQDILGFFIKWGDLIETVGKAWILYFAASKFGTWASAAMGSLNIVSGGFGLLSTSLSRAVKGFQLARTFSTGMGNSIRSAVVNAATPFPALSAKVSGASGLLKNLGPVAIAAFAGWKIGRAISDLLGLDKVIQDIIDKLTPDQKEYDFFSELKAFKINPFQFKESADAVRQLGKELGVTSGKMTDYASAIWENEKAFENLNPRARELVNLLRHKQKVELMGEIRELGNTLGPATNKLMVLTNRIWGNKEAMEKLSTEGKELVKSFVDASGNIDPLSPKIRALTNEYKSQKDQIFTNKMQISNWISKINELSSSALPAEKKALDQMRGELEKRLKILEKEINLNKEQKKAYEELGKEIGVLTDKGYEDLSNKQVAAIKLWGEKKEAILGNQQSIITFQGVLEDLSDKMGDKVNPRIKEMLNILQESTVELPKVKTSFDMFLPSVEKVNAAFDTDVQKLFKKAVSDSTASMGFLKGGVESLDKEMKLLNAVFEKNKGQIGKNKEATSELHDWIKTLIGKYKILEKDVPPGLKELYEKTKTVKDETGDLVKVFASLSQIGGQVIDALKEMGIVSEKTAGQLRGVVSGVSGIGAGLDAWKKADEMGKGFSSILGKISAGLGIFSSAVSIIGSLVSAIGGLFNNHDWDKWTKKVNFAGISLGEFSGEVAELAEQLRDGQVSTYAASFEAFNRTLYKVIQNSNSINADNFERYASAVHTIFSQLDDIAAGKSTASISQTLEDIGNAFEALVQKQQELGGRYSAEMTQIIGDMENRGLEIASITQYQLNEMQEGFDDYKDYIAGEFSHVTFGAFQEMFEWENAVAENDSLYKKIKGFEGALKHLSNAGKLTANDWENALLGVQQNFELLEENSSFTSEQILEAMAPTLSRIIELSNAHNYTIDETTQSYIDQARQAGISLKKQMDPQERMVEVLEMIYELLGGKIPQATAQMARDGESAFGNMKYQTTLWQDALEDTEERIENIGKAMGSLDDDVVEHMSGNTILEEFYAWIDTLKNTKGELEAIRLYIEELDASALEYEPSYENFLLDLQNIASLLNVTIPEGMTDIGSIYEYLDGLVSGQLENMFSAINRFDLFDFGIISDELLEQSKTDFEYLTGLWEKYSSIISSNTEGLQNFYDALAGLTVPEDMQADWESFLTMIGGLLDEATIQTIEWNGITFTLADSFQFAGTTFTNTLDAMITDEVAFEEYLNNLAAAAGITIPDEFDTMMDRFSYVMSQMGLDVDDFVVDANGQIATLSDAIMNLGDSINDAAGFGSRYGIANEADREANTEWFSGAYDMFYKNYTDLVNNKTGIKNLYNDLEDLPLIDDPIIKEKFDRLWTSVRQAYTHSQRGDTLILNAAGKLEWKAGENTGGESEESEPPRSTWTPRPSRTASKDTTTTPSTSSTGSAAGEQTSGGNNYYIFDFNFEEPVLDERDLILKWKKAVEGNQYGTRKVLDKIIIDTVTKKIGVING